jgi:DNA-binding NtrC family response regulator
VKPRRILLVEDEPILLRTLSRTLELSGLDVTVAEDGRSALRLLESGPAFEAVVTDLTLEGAGGMEVLRKAKERDPETGVIVITGYASESSALDALRFGAEDYLAKPFDYSELLLRVSRCLERRELARKVRLYERILGVCGRCGRLTRGGAPGLQAEELAEEKPAQPERCPECEAEGGGE